MSYDALVQLLTQLRDLADKRMAEVVAPGLDAKRSGSAGIRAGSSLKKHLGK